jgi:hypothetical protein
MNKKVYRRSLTYALIGIVVLAIAFLVGTVAWFNGKVAMGCMASMSAFGLILLIFYGLMDNKPRVVIDEDGISARDWGGIKLLWTDIQDVKVVNLPRQITNITLELYDKNKYLQQLSGDERFSKRVSKWFNEGEFSFNVDALDVPTTQIYTEIKQRIDQAAKENVRSAPATEA